MSKGRPRTCETCDARPVAMPRGRQCYECMPGGPITPPPCRRCGSSGNYYSSGLCSRCHLYAPQSVESCRVCDAWGVTRHTKWVCQPCATWAAKYPMGVCASCERTIAVNTDAVCRPCWRQAAEVRRPHQRIDPVAATRNGQQLLFANMRKALHNRATHTEPASAGVRMIRPVEHRQLVLFNMGRRLDFSRHLLPKPRDSQLAAALEAFQRDYARQHRWLRQYSSDVRSGINILLGLQDTVGAPITTTDAAVLSQLRLPVRAVCEVLAAAGMLEDDRTPAVDLWFARQVTGLPDAMVDELSVWFQVMLHGSRTTPRRRPRTESGTRGELMWALPTLRAWAAAGHLSLREISRNDIVAALPSGVARTTTGTALRSILGLLKARKIIFVNPIAGVRTWVPNTNAPLPLDPAKIRDALISPDPARAAIAALVAFHGLRTGELVSLKLTDVRDGRLHFTGRTVLLAEPASERLRRYIEHRNRRWPTTINTHLFIHFRTAARTEPVGGRWVKLVIDIPGGVQAVREDRILHEAHATGGDTRRLCDLFGLSINGATRYAATVDHPDLIAQRAEPQ